MYACKEASSSLSFSLEWKITLRIVHKKWGNSVWFGEEKEEKFLASPSGFGDFRWMPPVGNWYRRLADQVPPTKTGSHLSWSLDYYIWSCNMFVLCFKVGCIEILIDQERIDKVLNHQPRLQTKRFKRELGGYLMISRHQISVRSFSSRGRTEKPHLTKN